MSIGEKLKNMRLEKNLTQQSMADFLKINRTTYAKYEAGTIEVNASTLTTLSNFFKVSSDYLLGIECPSKTNSNSSEPDVTEAEYSHILNIRKLNDRDRGFIEGQVALLLQSKDYQKESTRSNIG